MTTTYWHQSKDENNVLWLALDCPNASTNTLDEAVLKEFSDILKKVNADKSIKGLIIHSKKQNGFIAGANIETFTTLTTSDKVKPFLKFGQDVFAQLEALTIPTVALIHGFCLGGGLELALACRYRIAVDDEKTRIGLPEVKLGILPGWGGSVRMPRLIGAGNALPLILAGRALRTSAAKKVGLVDAAVPMRQLKRAGSYYCKHQPKPHTPSLFQKALALPGIASLFALLVRSKTQKKVNPAHYPNIFTVIDNWAATRAKGQAAYDREISSIGHLIDTSDLPRHLIHLFFQQERLKHLAKDGDFTVKHVHVVGAGIMGGDIAAWCALKGLKVTLQDRETKYIAPAIARAAKLYKKRLKKTRLIQAALDRLIPDVPGEGAAQADVIIEAIYENLEAKQTLFKSLEAKAKPDAVLATNTSSLPLDDINQTMKNPGRLVGIHFFNPVPKMQLIEVVQGNKTREAVLSNAIQFVRAIDRLPLPVKSSPGFLINRVLMPYLMEAMTLLNEGVPAETIDKAAVEFGMPMGPVALADTVGLDVCLSVGEYLTNAFGGSLPPQLKTLVGAGHLGRKTGQGFYHYDKAGRQQKAIASPDTKSPPNVSKQAIADRLVARLIDESKACLKESVVADADLLDVGMVFGTGFAPFRGGPMQYAKDIGKQHNCLAPGEVV